MPSNFSSLRSSRKTLLDKLAQAAKQENSKGGDDRFWKLTVDAKTKVGHAVIRFLPAPPNEEMPWVRRFAHQFKGPQGNWLFENCPTTLDASCPICKDNSALWRGGLDADKKIASDRKRKQRYIANILVVEDAAHPENNGKVFLFEYGPKIHEKLKEVIEPEFPDVQPLNPFDLWEGANFKLRSRDVAGFQNYDKSEFDKPSELFPDDDAKKEDVWTKQHSLQAFIAGDQFKPYEAIEKNFVRALSGDEGRPKTAEEAIRQVQAQNTPTAADAEAVQVAVQKTERKQLPPRAKKEKEKPTEPEVVEDDDVASFFRNLDAD